MIAVFVDGPAKGSIRDIGATDSALLIGQDGGGSGGGPEIVRAIYHIHHFQLSGHGIRVASLHSDVDDVRPDDVFEVIASDLAKEAVIS
jgi:hypothetical protein